MDRGGTPPPLTDNPQIFFKKNGSKRAKISVFWPKIAVFLADFFLKGIGGTHPPFTENHCAQKSLAERGEPPPPLTEKIR